jgi:hypothetical protein
VSAPKRKKCVFVNRNGAVKSLRSVNQERLELSTSIYVHLAHTNPSAVYLVLEIIAALVPIGKDY